MQQEPKTAGGERLLVCLDPSPFSLPLIRATKRIADAQQTKWYALYVETPAHDRLPLENQEQVAQALYQAAKLGAQAVKVSGFRIGDEILAFARENGVSKILVGKPYARRWRRFLGISLVDHLIWNCGSIDVFVISGEGEEEVAPAPPPRPKPRRLFWEYLLAAGVVILCTALAWILFPHLALRNLAMIYLLTVVIISPLLARGPALFSSFLSVAAFAFFFVPEYYSFSLADSEYAVTLAVMLLVSTLVSGLTTTVRHKARVAREQERKTAAMFEMNQNLTALNSLEELLNAAATQISQIFDSRVAILMPQGEHLEVRAGHVFADEDVREGMVASWVFKHGHLAGAGTGTLSAVKSIYLPLMASQQIIGVLRVEPVQPGRILEADSLRLLEALGSQAGLAIERENLSRQAQAAQLQMEAEQMRNTLLSSVSHDLRTPLTVIAGSASSLLEGENTLDSFTKHELAQNIYEEAKRLDRLVHNLLEMSRLQSGQAVFHQEWYVLEEVIGSALAQLDSQLHDHPVRIHLPTDLPLVRIDALLLERVVINLLENCMKYTPPGTPLEITGSLEDQELLVAIADRGPGLPPGEEERIFEKFYQVAPGSARGAGLGLTICRRIIEAHGGRIWAANRPGGGAVFNFTIPLVAGAPLLDKNLPEDAAEA